MDDPSLSLVVYESAVHSECVARQLVLRMAQVPNETVQLDGAFVIRVDPQHADRARFELERYAEENRSPVLVPRAPANVSSGWAGTACYVGVLAAVAALQHQHAFALDWLNAGKAQAGLIREGEWWRTVTALCLHADGVHLAGNLVFGAVFGLLASQRFGSGVAWFGIVLAGALGNALSAFVQLPSGSSVGASTAVFGALGLLTAHTWRTAATQGGGALVRWAPVICGLLLLSLLGTGGERTNVFAHATGFGCGALIGVLFASIDRAWLVAARHQVALGAAASAMVMVAWVLALAR